MSHTDATYLVDHRCELGFQRRTRALEWRHEALERLRSRRVGQVLARVDVCALEQLRDRLARDLRDFVVHCVATRTARGRCELQTHKHRVSRWGTLSAIFLQLQPQDVRLRRSSARSRRSPALLRRATGCALCCTRRSTRWSCARLRRRRHRRLCQSHHCRERRLVRTQRRRLQSALRRQSARARRALWQLGVLAGATASRSSLHVVLCSTVTRQQQQCDSVETTQRQRL